MIRRIINRMRRQEPSQPVLFTHDRVPAVTGRPAVNCSASSRRGATRRPMRMVRLQNRAQSKRARAARKRNRV